MRHSRASITSDVYGQLFDGANERITEAFADAHAKTTRTSRGPAASVTRISEG